MRRPTLKRAPGPEAMEALNHLLGLLLGIFEGIASAGGPLPGPDGLAVRTAPPAPRTRPPCQGFFLERG